MIAPSSDLGKSAFPYLAPCSLNNLHICLQLTDFSLGEFKTVLTEKGPFLKLHCKMYLVALRFTVLTELMQSVSLVGLS